MRWFVTDYASDMKHVYYQGKVLEGIKPIHATLLEQHFEQIVLTDGLDKYLAIKDWNRKDGYLKDKRLVYYNGKLLKEANGEHFEWLTSYEGYRHFDYDYARDNQHIYLYGQKVAGDPNTAYEINYGYYLDADHIYFRGEVLEGASPNAFELKSFLIVSNGHVYYRAKRLTLDANTFQVLNYMHGRPYIACGGTTYTGSLIKDRDGIYILHASGELEQLDGADANTFKVDSRKGWAADKQWMYHYWELGDAIEVAAFGLSPQQAYQEDVGLEKKRVMTFYRDKHSIYPFSQSAAGVGNLKDLFGGDAKTFNAYAALSQAVIFHDATGFYYAKTAYAKDLKLVKFINGKAKLVCFEADHLCLLSGNVLYYIFDDGIVEQVQVKEKELQCIKGDTLLPPSLAKNTGKGMCFDRSYFYHKDELKKMSLGEYNEALSYKVTVAELEQKRAQSLKRVRTERKPLLIEEQPVSDTFKRWYFL